MESFVPFGGFFPTAHESSVPVMKPFPSLPRCQLCNDKYEEELSAILKGCTPSCEAQSQAKLPSWLQSIDMVRMSSPLASEVHVQSDPAGRLIISGEPEQLDNPWGVTPFKKVVTLPSPIDPHQTSAVVTLHGQLFVRAPFEQSDL